MKQFLYAMLATTAMSWGMGAYAQMSNCTEEIRKVDEALEKNTKMDPPRAGEVRRLRDEAQKLQGEGKPTECLATIERAKAMLGIR